MWPSSAWRPHWSLLLEAIALAGLVGVLAVLQYRWLGQIGEADAARLRSAAHSRADRFAREFDREITLAFVSLQADAATLRGADPQAYAARWARWSHLSSHPGIVQAVFLVRDGALLLFVPRTGTFQPAEWPPLLHAIRERLHDPGWPPHGPPPGDRGPRDLIDADVPAILAPVREFGGGAPAGGGPSFGFRMAGFTLIILDSRHLREQLLPELARRHFTVDGESEYGVRIDRRGSPGDVVFASDPSISADGPADVTVGLFGIRMEDLPESDLGGLPWPMPGAARSRAGPSPFAGGRPPSFGAALGHWRLLARHRAGSVDAVVAAVRRRNLAVSGGILLLLLASTYLILVSAQRARRLADRQVEFVAGVSHELRTPVSVICAAGDNLAAGVVTDSASAREYGRIIRDEGRRLADMVERVLDLAGTYSGRRKWHFQNIALEPLLAESRESVEPAARERGVDVDVRVEAPLPLVRAERSALRRAVVNLLQNAILHGSDGGFVELRAEAIGAGRAAKVRVTIEDRGRGIPPVEVPHLFEPFFRGEEAVSSQTRGSGLGLSLVKRIVVAHGGAVEVKTAPGRGSAFAIVLPALVESTSEPPDTAG
jgi:signal transduction histidine kinase